MAILKKIYSDLDLRFVSQPGTKDVSMSYDEQAVIRSVKNLLLTRPYERLFNPLLSSQIDNLLFEPITPLTGNLLKEKEVWLIKSNENNQLYLDFDNTDNKLYLNALGKLSLNIGAITGAIPSAINLWQSQNNNYEDFPTYEQLKEFLYKSDNIFKNNKGNIKEGVSELFESNPKLASIGTQEQYSQYLDTIFPDSKVKDIVYHGSKSELRVYNGEVYDILGNKDVRFQS